MGRNAEKWFVSRGLFVAAAALVAAVLLVGRAAYADDYSIDRVSIDATVGADGTLDVIEERTFAFDGSFHGVYWELPKGTYEGRTIEPEVVAAGEYVNGSYVSFANSTSGANGTYSISDTGSALQVKLYSAHSDESVTFVLSYRDQNLASRWADTGELYWKFVSDGWDVESQNITCTVHLPVPAGESVDAGSNVRAWGHGPLDATVSFNGSDVVYTVPGVGTNEYAEARIVFPQSWLSGEEASSENRLESILSEERQLADAANAQRARARVTLIALYVVGAALVVFSLLVIFRARKRYRESHAPHFDDKYFRDVPSYDHPAVLGALLRDGTPSTQDFSASLMRLTDLGYVELSRVTVPKRGLLGRKKGTDTYRISRTKKEVTEQNVPAEARDASREAAGIDRATLQLMFDVVARRAPKVQLEDGSSTTADDLLVSDFEKVAQSSPQAYSDAYDTWKNDVFAACTKRGFFVDGEPSQRGKVIAAVVLDFVGAFALVMASLGLGFTPLAVAIIVALIIAGAVGIRVVSGFVEVSREAIELRAKLGALRNWLCDFTRLKEAWPRDVVLWNRLLVMAVVLGVADRVIDQLKVAAPEMLESTAMAPVYGWYYYGPVGGPSPLAMVGDSFNTAHSVSVAQLAQSSMSSAAGGGGGFSSGGGGGFGGGGGGGAF